MQVTFRYKHLRSYVAGRVPTPAQLLEGQFAINIPDKKIYTKDSSGNILDLTDYVSVDVLESQYIKQGVVPITQIGAMGGIQALPISSASASTLNVTQNIPVLLSGRQYNMAAGPVTVPTAFRTNGTVTLCYFELSESNIVMTFSLTPLTESIGRVYVGKITSTGSGFTVALNTVTRIDIYRLSTTNVGSAIPISQGSPSQRGYFDSSWGFVDE